jgi:hypothetical protein
MTKRGTAAAVAALSSALVLTIVALLPLPAIADGAYQCDSSAGNIAIVNACGARWRAANVRAHVAAKAISGQDASCASSYADVLEQLAAKWASAKVYSEFTGTWPCGSEPNVASDDGILEKACPNKVWSYSNAGVSGCIIIAVSQPDPEPRGSAVSQSAQCDSAARQLFDRGFTTKIRLSIGASNLSRYSTSKATGIEAVIAPSAFAIGSAVIGGSADIGILTADIVDTALKKGIMLTTLGSAGSVDGHELLWFATPSWAQGHADVAQQFVGYMKVAALCS